MGAMTKRLLFLQLTVVAMMLFPSPIFARDAPIPGLWIGNQSIDPITDQNNSMAFSYEPTGAASIGVRCQNKKLDLLLMLEESSLHIGDRKKVIMRFGKTEPVTVTAIVTGHKILAFDPARPQGLLPAIP